MRYMSQNYLQQNLPVPHLLVSTPWVPTPAATEPPSRYSPLLLDSLGVRQEVGKLAEQVIVAAEEDLNLWWRGCVDETQVVGPDGRGGLTSSNNIPSLTS